VWALILALPLRWLRSVLRRATRSRTIARWLFGVDFLPLEPGEAYFDMTTPILVRVAARHLGPDTRLLDMGTGAFATVGLALWRRSGCRVLSTDIHPDIVARARANAVANHAPIEVREARFFDGVGPFDCVTFNPPYVPTARVDKTERLAFQSDGGPHGTTVIEGFLEAFSHSQGQMAFLGVNTLHVGRDSVMTLVGGRKGLVLEDVVGSLLGVDVFVLRRLEAQAAEPGNPAP